MRAGNSHGVEALLRVHGPNVKSRLRVAFGRRASDPMPEDATHDAAMSLFRGADKIDPNGNLGGYFYVAARHEMLRHAGRENTTRHHQLWDGAEEHIAAPNAAGALTNDISTRVRALVDSLPQLECDVLMLDQAHDFDLPAKEAAAILGTTPEAVYSTRNRTKKRFEKLLGLDRGDREGPEEKP